MKNIKKIFAVGTLVLALGATSISVLADSAYKNPAEAVAGITGRTLESVVAERYETGKSFGTIASEAGKLDEFKAEILEIKKDSLNAQVEAGRITRERADAIIKAMEENQAVCDGTGTGRMGQNSGAGFCSGTGLGEGCGNRGTGSGRGQGGGGRGMGFGGMGLQDGSCYASSN